MLNGRDATALKFARKGYDVWLGNNRGNQFSRAHTYLDPDIDSQLFFDYSFWELALYDVPAQIDYVLEKTGREQISYMGHSQGNTQMFTALAENFGNMTAKINFFVAIAPVTKLGGSFNLFYEILSAIYPALLWIFEKLGIYELFGPRWQSFHTKTCTMFSELCQQKGLRSVHIDDPSINENGARLLNSRTMSGSSVKENIHYAQIYRTDNFTRFDFGSELENFLQYKSENFKESPPQIKISAITTPTALYVGLDDNIATPTDAKWLRDEIPSVVSYTELEGFGHATFNFGNDMSYLDMIEE